MDEPVWAQMGFRLVFYVASIAVSLAFFAVVPVGTRWYSAYGSRTMYAYLLHLMVIRSYELCRDYPSSTTKERLHSRPCSTSEPPR